MDNITLYNRIITKSKDQLLKNWVPVIKIFKNYLKVQENFSLYSKNYKEVFEVLEKILEKIKENDLRQTITLVQSEKLPDVIIDYIIVSILSETALFYAKTGNMKLSIINYLSWLSDFPDKIHEKILYIDLRNLYLRNNKEQEKYLSYLLEYTNKRNDSKLINIIVIDDTVKDIIVNKNYIEDQIKNTIIINNK